MKVIHVIAFTPAEHREMMGTVDQMKDLVKEMEPGPSKVKLAKLIDRLWCDLTYKEVGNK